MTTSLSALTIPQILDAVVATEGGYTNNPDDLGGPTIWGITERVARRNGYDGDMRSMNRNTAKTIYLREYVQRPGFDKVHELSARIGAEVIDTGVNMGTAVAGLMLQRALNALNAKGTLYPDLKADGDVGPATITALRGYLAARGATGEIVMLRVLNSLQGARYVEISEGRQANETFCYGWFLNRVVV